jgi:Zn-dependent protease with chaperone function
MTAGVAGRLFPPGAARSGPADLRLAPDGRVRLSAGGPGDTVEREVDLAAATVSSRIGRVPRRIEFPDGATFETGDNDGVDALLVAAGRRPASTVHGWERFRLRLVVVVVLAVVLGGALLRFGVPAAADLATGLVPHDVDAAVGEHTLFTLDKLVFGESRASDERKAGVRRAFGELVAASRLEPDETRLEFRRGGEIGANAFALPGGIVVVTDEMLSKAPDDDALAGVLAHELGHVEGRHGMRRVLRAAGLGAATLVIFGDPGAVLDEMTGFAAVALDLSYSRSFEAEADARAAELLVATGRSPDDLARLLAAFIDEDDGDAVSRWLSSHPQLSDRVEALRRTSAP